MPNNLKNTEATQFRSGSQAVENGRKGGKASAIAKRKKNAARIFLKEVLAYKPEMTVALAKNLKNMGADPENEMFTTEKLMMIAMIQKGMKGDIQAVKLALEMLGEDAKTMIEEKRIKMQKEAVEAICNSDGFMDAMTVIAEEVFADGGDTPDTLEDSD